MLSVPDTRRINEKTKKKERENDKPLDICQYLAR